EREGAEPFARQFTMPLGLGRLELSADAGGTTPHAEDAGQRALCLQAGFEASRHRVPDLVEPGRDLLLAAQGLFVDARGLGDRDAAVVAHREQLVGRREADREAAGGGARFGRLALPADEAAADGVVR